jgi:hypothetical protein
MKTQIRLRTLAWGGATRFIRAALLAATPAFAATWTWNGSQGNDHWTNTGNWSPIGPVANDGTANVIFSGALRTTPDLAINWNVNSVTFNNTGATSLMPAGN